MTILESEPYLLALQPPKKDRSEISASSSTEPVNDVLRRSEVDAQNYTFEILCEHGECQMMPLINKAPNDHKTACDTEIKH